MSDLLVLRLTRIKQSADGTFGRLVVPGVDVNLVTEEDDWHENLSSISCIPAGIYTLHRTIYHKHGFEVFEVTHVPGRQHVLLHPGNTEEDTKGCILPGLRFGRFLVAKDEDTGAPKVMKEGAANSKAAFDLIMAALAHVDEAIIDITWAPGLPI